MASLVGQQLKDTYDSLLKTSDNDALGGTYKEITDGAGNGSGLYLGTGGRVGIGASPTAKLSIVDSPAVSENVVLTSNSRNTGANSGFGDYTLFGSSTTSSFALYGRKFISGPGWLSSQVASGGFLFSTGALGSETERMRIHSGGDISFRDTSTNEAFYWDASTARLGLGTTSPNRNLHVEGDMELSKASGNAGFRIVTDATSEGYLIFGDPDDNSMGGVIYDNATDALMFDVNNAERMRIDSSGNVGIGTDSPDFSLSVGNDSDSSNYVSVRASNTGSAGYLFSDAQDADVGYVNYSHATNHMGFGTNGSEAMRIDSSGNVLVGMTTYSTTDDGHYLGANGMLFSQADGLSAGTFSRLTNDGDIVRFRKDSTTVGSIASHSGQYLLIGNTDTALGFIDAGSPHSIRPYSITSNSSNDDGLDFGASSARWQDIYATNGTIQTSDINEKQDIEELDDAELRVAQKAKTLLRKYRWKSSVEEKGDEARIHFGIIAQDLEQAFADEGLDAGRYGMFIKSTWTNEEGEEQTRLGVRYNQLLAFIISAL